MITSFTGFNRWLSNFWPVIVKLDGEMYPSIENAYQAAKTLELPNRKYFTDCSPGHAKQRGKTLNIRKDWDDVKVSVMKSLIEQKFTETNGLGKSLISTGNIQLIEGNTWNDTFWGVCNGRGLNTLGKLLMARRKEIMPR